MSQSGLELTFWLLATITLKVVPFYVYAPFPALLPFLKSILYVVFCEGVQHCMKFCLDHLNFVKIAAFQCYLQSGKQRKVGWLFLIKHSLVKKEV
jgi:hypothetical protein